MKIGLAQIGSIAGDLKANMQHHMELMEFALSIGVEFLFFPELSLTGYQTTLAKEKALDPDDALLDIFQDFSDRNGICVTVGLPIKSTFGVHISNLIFQPLKKRHVYSKSFLHDDEIPFFIPGNSNPLLEIQGIRIGLAICYEISVDEHLERIKKENIQVYLASVAKNRNGIDRARERMAELSKKISCSAFLCNAIGPMDGGPAAGGSGIWGKDGMLLETLHQEEEGIICWNPFGKKEPLTICFPKSS